MKQQEKEITRGSNILFHEGSILKMPGHSMHTYACVHVVRQICLKIPYNLLHMELTRTQVHKYDFSNRFG